VGCAARPLHIVLTLAYAEGLETSQLPLPVDWVPAPLRIARALHIACDEAPAACDTETAAMSSSFEEQGDAKRISSDIFWVARDGDAAPAASFRAALYAVILFVRYPHVAVWGDCDAVRLIKLLIACSCFPVADHCAAVPTTSCRAALYAVIVLVRYDDVAVWG